MKVKNNFLTAVIFNNPASIDQTQLKQLALSFDELLVVGMDPQFQLSDVSAKLQHDIYIDNLLIDRLVEFQPVPEYVFEANDALKLGVAYHPILFQDPDKRRLSAIVLGRILDFGRRELLVRSEELPGVLNSNDSEQYKILEKGFGMETAKFMYVTIERILALTRYKPRTESNEEYFDAGFHATRVMMDVILTLSSMQKEQTIATCLYPEDYHLLLAVWKLFRYLSSELTESIQIEVSPMDISKLGLLCVNMIDSVVDRAEISNRSYAEIRKYKEANREAYVRFQEYLKSLVHELDDAYETDDVLRQTRKVIEAHVIPEARKVRDEMADVWSKMFGSIGVKAAGTLLTSGGSILSALYTPNVALPAALGSVAAVLGASVIENMVAAFRESRQAGRHGLAYLLRI